MRIHATPGPQRARRSGGTGVARGLLVLALLSGSCSFQGLDDLTPPYTPCQNDAECEALNSGFDEQQCERWICLESYCRLRRLGTSAETCDGRDEDCDGLIDEEGPLPVRAPIEGVSSRTLHATVVEPDGVATVTFEGPLDPQLDIAEAAGTTWTQTTLTLRKYGEMQEGALREMPLPCGSADEPLECLVFDAASTHLAGDLVVATFAGLVADTALLRIGLREAGATDAFAWLRGPSSRSSSWRGIEPAGGPRGRSVAIVAMPEASALTPQALVAFVSGDTDVVVEIVGIWIDDQPPARVIHATAPLVLSVRPRPDVERIALAAVSGEPRGAYLIAYPTRDGVNVSALPALPEPEPACTLPCVRGSEPLEPPADLLLPSIDATEVAIAASSRTLGLVLAFTDGDEVSLVAGEVVPGAPGTSGDTTVSLTGDFERWAAPDAEHLSIVRVEEGLSWTREDPRRGGYLLAYGDTEHTYVGRRADLTEETHLAELDHATFPIGRAIGANLSVIGGSDGELYEHPHACGPRPAR